MNIQPLENALSAAWKRKRPLLEATEAVRLLNAEASGVPRLVLELYGKHALFYDYGSDSGEALRAAAPAWRRDFGWESISWLDRTVAAETERTGNFAVEGTPPERLIVREGDLRFAVEPRHPRNVGLFLDTRELRKDLAGRARDARVLNLFAYTGSLGLAALAGGAREVVQVDVSARYLEWGRENLRLNGFAEEACRFTRMDSERYLDWAAKKGLAFNHVILDPPVFSRFEGRTFRFAEDYFRLVAKCLARLSPGGTLHAVTNYAGITPAEFSARLREAVREAGPAGKIRAAAPERVPLPPDFDLAPDAIDRPEGNALIFQIEVQ